MAQAVLRLSWSLGSFVTSDNEYYVNFNSGAQKWPGPP